SRRRHTRFSRDWSSDVCSSDLGMISPFTRLMCFALSFAAFRAIASTADRTTSASYGRLPHGVKIGVYPAITLTWDNPARRENKFPNTFCNQFRCSVTGSPPFSMLKPGNLLYLGTVQYKR